jgi:hypothetical protein
MSDVEKDLVAIAADKDIHLHQMLVSTYKVNVIEEF